MSKSSTGRIWTILALLLSLLVLPISCGSSPREAEEEASVEGVILPRTPPTSVALSEEQRLEQENQLQSLLDQAALLHVKEDYRAALEVIRIAATMNPPEPFGHRFRALEIKVRADLLRRCYLDAFVRFDRPWYTIGETIEGEIILMNISDQLLVVPATTMVAAPDPAPGAESAEQESRSVVRSVMTYREYLPSNTVITNRQTENFGIPQDIRLQPGETHRIPVAIDTNDINVAGQMYRRYRIACSLHAAEIRVGDEIFHGVLEYRPAHAGVFPRNAEHLADEPMTRVRQALAKASPLHLSLAAAFIDPRDQAQCRAYEDFCLEELERPEGLPRMQDALMCGLAILQDDENNRSKEDWISWLRKRRRR
ncbi:MAG: hypothetical protein H6807_01755 [Planctomycetes bacterium]|nr:hypothetical protein [Planctomycetota bacterium]